jgi:hypothetical protein
MTLRTRSAARGGYLPPQLAIGLVMVAIVWPLAWAGPVWLSQYTFFPLWLGYILTVDGMVSVRGGTSLLERSTARFALLFVFSIPLWWLFEVANRFLGNWEYRSPREYMSVTYVALASLAFSTVMPAMFVTAQLWRTVIRREVRWLRIAPGRNGLITIAVAGLMMFVGSLVFPDILFPFVWIGLFLLVDPINRLTGGSSIAGQVAERRWDTVLVLFAAGLTCGFFWEMWNINSNPKWVYDIPYVGFLKIFEMPLLGYGGYLPFALEIYAAYHLLHTLVFRARDRFLDFDEAGERRVTSRSRAEAPGGTVTT